MRLFLIAGMFQHKSLRSRQVLPLAAAYVGYIVLCNLSLKVNTVGFYQVGVCGGLRCGVLGIFGSDVV
jgi:solute carrier family 35 protein E3